MRSSHLFFELHGRVLLPISTDLHHATGILLAMTTSVVDSGGIQNLRIPRKLRRTLAACGEATLVAYIIWNINVLISNELLCLRNGTVDALVETAAQFHAVD